MSENSQNFAFTSIDRGIHHVLQCKMYVFRFIFDYSFEISKFSTKVHARKSNCNLTNTLQKWDHGNGKHNFKMI